MCFVSSKRKKGKNGEKKKKKENTKEYQQKRENTIESTMNGLSTHILFNESMSD